jgi:hypothetical protein
MKKIYLMSSIPILLVVVFMIWTLILEGFSSSSDYLVLLSALASGVLMIALYKTIKFYLKQF